MGVGWNFDIQEHLDLGNDVCMDGVGKLWYLGKVWSCQGVLTKKDVSLKLKWKAVCEVCEKCNSVWK